MSRLRPVAQSRVARSRVARSRVVAWALWDCGATGLTAITVTFVFSVYLTGTVGRDLPGDTSPASLLGRALTISGLAVAVLAPLTGVIVQAPHRRRVVLTTLTASAAFFTGAMSLIRDDPRYLVAGLALLALTAACGDLASVPYNAMLRQLSDPQTAGRVSGLGWAAGYTGSVVLLVVVYVGFMRGEGPERGLLGLPVADGQNVRAAMILTACWFVLCALPLLLTAHTVGAGSAQQAPAGRFPGVLGGYRQLWADLRAEWQRDRNLVYYLVVSAVFRDGLAAVFAFGAVRGGRVYSGGAAVGAGPGICRGSNIVLHTPTRATGSRQLLLDSHPSIACCWQCCQVVHNPQLLLSTPAAPAMIAHAPPQLHRPCPAVTQTASCGWARGLPSTVPG